MGTSTTMGTSTDAGAVALEHARRFAPGERVFDAGSRGGCWRVLRGVTRLDRPSTDGPVLAMLALPGDWLGADTLCGHPQPWHATAVTPLWLQPCEPRSEQERQQWIVQALLQQPERCHDMARLRTGSVAARVAAFLQMLQDSVGAPSWTPRQPFDTQALRALLPPLRVIADLVDAKHETVCRVLGQLLPREPARGRQWAVA
jgi:hypothetical protein